MAKMFRLLRADEIECRVARCGLNKSSDDKRELFGWCQILLYKDARCDMNILDETVGATGWMRRHSRDNANCEVGIYTQRGWIWKEDTGTESNTEAAKGLASDSFKRACVNWGIGRELYTSPGILINGIPLKENKRGTGYEPKGRFILAEIAYNEREEVCKLVIDFAENGRAPIEVYRFGSDPEKAPAETDEDLERLKSAYPPAERMREYIFGKLNRNAYDALLERNHATIIDDLTYPQLVAEYNRAGGR